VSHTRAVLRIRADDHATEHTCGMSDVASHPHCHGCDAHPKTHESHTLLQEPPSSAMREDLVRSLSRRNERERNKESMVYHQRRGMEHTEEEGG
jgi:hypothetical protein